ncbi:MAG: caspase family protein [Spirochaetaceae bacterium]|nr:MAG: caspase family protein [Spirochaetaceae bacterium]
MSMISGPDISPPASQVVRRTFRELLLPISLATVLALLAACTFDLNYDKYAIVYGISDYPGTADDLSSTDDDARDIEALLTSQGFQVIVRVTDDGTIDDPDGGATANIDEASYDQLTRDFQNVAAQADLDDLFLFYFSGHGIQIPLVTSENTPGSDGEDEAIVLISDDLNLKVNLIDDDLAGLLRTIPCARRIVILDACYSGGFIGNSAEADAIPADYSQGSNGLFETLGDTIYLYANFQDYGSDIRPSDAVVIAASGEQDFAYESGGNGVMTSYLLESATMGDLNSDGFVTVSEAYFYIYKNIDKYFNAVFWPYTDVFFPHVSGGPVDYILFVN